MDWLEGRALLSTISAVRWQNNTVAHSTLYAIAKDDSVEVSVDGGAFTNLGGYAKQISAGLDVFGKPEVYAIGVDNAVYVNDSVNNAGFVRLGGYAKQISATLENTLYAIGPDDALYQTHGSPGLGFVRLGGQVRQISAGGDGIGNPLVYVIGYDNAVYVDDGIGTFTKMFGYARQISATMDNTFYAIGADNSVYKITGPGTGTVTNLGGYAKQISAGLDASNKPDVFVIGIDDALYVNHGFGYNRLGAYVTDISATAVGPLFAVSFVPNDLAYATAKGHGGLLYDGSFVSLGGYIQTSSGSANNNTNSWAPATRDASAVAWTSGGVAHHALYAIAPDDTVEVSVDGGAFTNLGGYAKQVSAGLDAFGKPEVYAIGVDNAIYVSDNGAPFVRLGGYAKEISATVGNTFYHIGTDDAVYLGHGVGGPGFVRLGGQAKQISAGVDSNGAPEVFFIGFDDGVYLFNGLGGFNSLGGYAKQISASTRNVVYAIGPDNSVFKNTGIGTGSTWVPLGGYAKQISAGLDGTFGPFVFAIGVDDGLWSNHGGGWVSFGGYITEVSGPAVSNFVVASLQADLGYVVGKGHGGFLHEGVSFLPLAGGSIE